MTVENGELYGAHACPSGMDSPRQLRMRLPAVSHSVRLSRYATRAVLTAWQLGHMDEAATLLVSELVTNAVRHARGTDVITVDVLADKWGVRDTTAGKAVWAELDIRRDGVSPGPFGMIS